MPAGQIARSGSEHGGDENRQRNGRSAAALPRA
jgi:hypothetical protein